MASSWPCRLGEERHGHRQPVMMLQVLAGAHRAGSTAAASWTSELSAVFINSRSDNSLIDFADVVGDQSEDMRARCNPAASDFDDSSDRVEGQAEALGGTNEREPLHRVVAVIAVARRGSGGCIDDSDLFVIANRLR